MKRLFKKLAAGIEDNFDNLVFELRKRLKRDAPLEIVTYRSYGNPNRLYVKGRVLKYKEVSKASKTDTIWQNLVNVYKRFDTDEVRRATVQLTFLDKKYTAVTDDEGYFTINLQTSTPIIWESIWYEIEVALVDSPVSYSGVVKSLAHVLVPPSDCEYGIISDIDDTIVKTTATSLLIMSKNTFFHNAHTRLPFAGVSEFYKSLQLGKNGKRNNPFFYVSSSPWNLYDLLIDFMDINDIPPGPLLLRDFGLDANKKSEDHMGHKYHEITQILQAYPDLKFVLIGDSGQEDPVIYREVVRKNPGRILAIYIRDVQLKDREQVAVDVAKQMSEDKVEMVIVDNTVEAAEHAAKIGLIFQENIGAIVDDKKLDKGEKPGKAEM